MNALLRKIFAPILDVFESGSEEYSYKKSRRTILVVVGVLFYVLSFISVAAAIVTGQFAAILPFLIFFCVASVCVIVGCLGSDFAVAKIWGNK